VHEPTRLTFTQACVGAKLRHKANRIGERRFGNGVCFDGASGYIDYGEGPDAVYDMGVADFTVELWIKSGNPSGKCWTG